MAKKKTKKVKEVEVESQELNKVCRVSSLIPGYCVD